MRFPSPARPTSQFQKSGIAEIRIKGLPILWLRSYHRVNCIEQPPAIRVTKHNGTLTATFAYEFPKPMPTKTA